MATTPPLSGPLRILVAVAAPAETRTSSPALDIEAEIQTILDALGGLGQRDDAQVTISESGS